MKKGTVYFFTGLSGAGKTTIGGLFYRRLRERKENVILLDGDRIRPVFCEELGYSGEDRLKTAKRIFRVCKMLSDQGSDVVCCSISMYEEVRAWNREHIEHYREIYIRVKRETLLARNQKKLYTAGKNVVGVDLPFDEPRAPDIVLQNDGGESPQAIVEHLEQAFGLAWEQKGGCTMDLQERVSLKKADRSELYCLEPPFPTTNFLLELSNACNHKCLFCAHQKMKRKIGKMKPEMVESVLRQAYALGTREVGMYATGEPFLVPELPEYIRLAKEIGYTYVYLTSNGSLATPERIRAVVDAGVDSIKFSVNAPERRLYEFIHGCDDFDRVLEHLKYLNQYRQESGRSFKIYLTGILTRYTEHLREQYFQVFDGLADQIVFKDVYNQGGYMPEIDTLLKCTYDTEQVRRCNLPFDALCVTWEGYLSVENADFENMLVVADLNRVSLKDGWYGEKMKEVRRMFLEDKLEGTVCYGCVHHCRAPAAPLLPEYATDNPDMFLDWPVRERIKAAGLPYARLVYVPMAADILHPGHINILKTAASLGRVVVGLFSDEAIRSYKPEPYMSFEQRKAVVESLKYVDEVVCQETKDYSDNLRRFRPDCMVHGTDWREGPLAEVRQKAFDVMAEWGGEIVEPEYTQGVSSTQLKKRAKHEG